MDELKEEKGLRFNSNKPKWSLVPQSALLPMVEVLEFGAQKYAPYNWMKGLSVKEICESLKRHLDAFMEGENNDKESLLSHIGHIQCNALFLSWMMENKPSMDDRIDITQFNEITEPIKISYNEKDLEKAFIAGGKSARNINNPGFDEFLEKTKKDV